MNRHKPEEVVSKLGQDEVLVGQGVVWVGAIREIGITEQTYSSWRRRYGEPLKKLKCHGGGQGKLLSPAPAGCRANTAPRSVMG